MVSLFSFSQEEKQKYFDSAAKLYYNGKNAEALQKLDKGLKYYPDDQKLLNLKNVVKASMPKIEDNRWNNYNKDLAKLKADGYKEGQGGEGYISKELIDPNGKRHVFVKKVESPPGPSPQPTGEDPWKKFNEKERSLLNSGYKKGYGSDGDEEKSLTDPNGEVNFYHKKKKVEVRYVNANFKETGQNTMAWSDDLSKYAEKITIVFKTKNGTKESYDVTGKNRFLFESYNNQFHRVYCSVELIVQMPLNVVLKGELKKEIWCLCSM